MDNHIKALGWGRNGENRVQLEEVKFFDLIVCSLRPQLHLGILINGQGGTQLYDPFNTPHAQGNLHLGLLTGSAAWSGRAVINGPLAYFAAGLRFPDDAGA